MKKIILILLFAMSAHILRSQADYRHNIISLGIGPTFTGSGDNIGTGMFNECLLSLNNRMSLNGRLFFYMINEYYGPYGMTDLYDQQTGISLDAGINISPFKTGKRYLYFMGGGCLKYSASSYTSGNRLEIYDTNTGQSSTAVDFTYYSVDKGISPGYYFGLGFTENISPHIAYGLKCNFQIYAGGDVIWLIGINIGYDFH
jgi:hypothetical protein